MDNDTILLILLLDQNALAPGRLAATTSRSLGLESPNFTYKRIKGFRYIHIRLGRGLMMRDLDTLAPLFRRLL